MNELPLVLQLDVAGQPQAWINYEKSAYYYTKGLVAWSAAEVDFTLHGGKSRMTGEQSTLTMNTIIAIKGKVSAKQNEKMNRVALTNKTLFRRDQNLCAYCGNTFSPSHLTRDHIKPTSKGGPNIWMNVVTCCSPCNKKKDDKTLDQAHMQLLYVPYVPNRAEYLILQNKNILADQMEFLIKQVPKESRLLAA
jgi:5-methylcytosine-specific restriction endonuclease McrA